jgi:hypothetical protein
MVVIKNLKIFLKTKINMTIYTMLKRKILYYLKRLKEMIMKKYKIQILLKLKDIKRK